MLSEQQHKPFLHLDLLLNDDSDRKIVPLSSTRTILFTLLDNLVNNRIPVEVSFKDFFSETQYTVKYIH